LTSLERLGTYISVVTLSSGGAEDSGAGGAEVSAAEVSGAGSEDVSVGRDEDSGADSVVEAATELVSAGAASEELAEAPPVSVI